MEKKLYDFEILILFNGKKKFLNRDIFLSYDKGLVYRDYNNIANHYIKTFYNVNYKNNIDDEAPVGKSINYISFIFSSFEELYNTFYRLYKNNGFTDIDFYVNEDNKCINFCIGKNIYTVNEYNYKYFNIYFIFYENPEEIFSFFDLMTGLNYKDFLDFMRTNSLNSKNVL